MEERRQWTRDHPYFFGAYLAAVSAVIYTALAARFLDFWVALTIFGELAIVMVPLAAWMVKRRFGERPDAGTVPAPSYRRMWSTAPDGLLSGIMVVGAAGILVTAIDLITASPSVVTTVLGFGAGTWLATTAWIERRRR
jgi:hypothetical protein